MWCLIAVDCQYDFLPGGELGEGEGASILLPLSTLARQADLVVATRDWHPENHFSFTDEPEYKDGSWPPHGIQKTRGAKIHTSINKYADFVISKGTSRNPPDQYSAFAGKTLRPVETLMEILERSPINTIVVGGIDIMKAVTYTAFDASAYSYHTVIPLNCVAPSLPMVQDAERFARAGIEVVEQWRPG